MPPAEILGARRASPQKKQCHGKCRSHRGDGVPGACCGSPVGDPRRGGVAVRKRGGDGYCSQSPPPKPPPAASFDSEGRFSREIRPLLARELSPAVTFLPSGGPPAGGSGPGWGCSAQARGRRILLTAPASKTAPGRELRFERSILPRNSAPPRVRAESSPAKPRRGYSVLLGHRPARQPVLRRPLLVADGLACTRGGATGWSSGAALSPLEHGDRCIVNRF